MLAEWLTASQKWPLWCFQKQNEKQVERNKVELDLHLSINGILRNGKNNLVKSDL